MIRGNRNIVDPIGWGAAFFEWFATYLLIWPKDGIVSKESMRTVYDVSSFVLSSSISSYTRFTNLI